MKSYIENELKRNKIPKNIIQPRNRTADDGPIYWQATAVPVSQLANWWQGCKALI